MSISEHRVDDEAPVLVERALADAETLRKQGAYDQAAALLAQALRHGVREEMVYYRLGNVLVDAGNLEKAEMAYQKALAVDPQFANAVHNLAVVYRRQRRMSLYVKTYKQSQRMQAGRTDHKMSGVRGLLGPQSMRRRSRHLSLWGPVTILVIGAIVWLFYLR
jgi:tetratricopeptide (TPR) repeat protein